MGRFPFSVNTDLSGVFDLRRTVEDNRRPQRKTRVGWWASCQVNRARLFELFTSRVLWTGTGDQFREDVRDITDKLLRAGMRLSPKQLQKYAGGLRVVVFWRRVLFSCPGSAFLSRNDWSPVTRNCAAAFWLASAKQSIVDKNKTVQESLRPAVCCEWV